MKYFLAVLIILGCAVTRAADPSYSMTDLKTLADQSAWRELAAHLEDIRPADRGPEWNKVLEQTATGLLDQDSAADDAYSAFSSGENLLTRFPKLKSNQTFMAKRADTGLAFQPVDFFLHRFFTVGIGADRAKRAVKFRAITVHAVIGLELIFIGRFIK